jgi:hypothetical protein
MSRSDLRYYPLDPKLSEIGFYFRNGSYLMYFGSSKRNYVEVPPFIAYPGPGPWIYSTIKNKNWTFSTKQIPEINSLTITRDDGVDVPYYWYSTDYYDPDLWDYVEIEILNQHLIQDGHNYTVALTFEKNQYNYVVQVISDSCDQNSNNNDSNFGQISTLSGGIISLIVIICILFVVGLGVFIYVRSKNNESFWKCC